MITCKNINVPLKFKKKALLLSVCVCVCVKGAVPLLTVSVLKVHEMPFTSNFFHLQY